MSVGSSLGSGSGSVGTGCRSESGSGKRMPNRPNPHNTGRFSILVLGVPDQGVQEEIACLPVGEILEDRDGDRGEDAQVRTGALPATLCTIIFHPYSKHG